MPGRDQRAIRMLPGLLRAKRRERLGSKLSQARPAQAEAQDDQEARREKFEHTDPIMKGLDRSRRSWRWSFASREMSR